MVVLLKLKQEKSPKPEDVEGTRIKADLIMINCQDGTRTIVRTMEAACNAGQDLVLHIPPLELLPTEDGVRKYFLRLRRPATGCISKEEVEIFVRPCLREEKDVKVQKFGCICKVICAKMLIFKH